MKNITLIMVLFCATSLANTQETIPVSGGEAAGAGGTVSYTMYDLLGRLVNKGTVATFETKIGMKSLSIGVYIFRVQQNNKKMKAYKIIKK
jgi:hypothetical protein